MDLEDLLELERTLGGKGTSTRAILGYCLYLGSRESVSIAGSLSAEFGFTDDFTRDLLDWLEYLDVVVRTIDGRYRIEHDVLRDLHTVVEWLFSAHSPEQLAQATVANPDDVNLILNVPEGTNFDENSTIIGSLVDLLAGTEQSAIVLNPFYTQVGFDLLQEALLGIPDREAELTLVTRDLLQGNRENRRYVRQLVERLENRECTHRFSVFEFNKSAHENATFHAKAVIVDDATAYIGSANMTEGSLRNAVELGTIIEGKSILELAETVERMLASDLFDRVKLDEI